jgi:hypothetical protein
MLDTKQLNSLGKFWSEEGNAVSFYFSESQPENRAHRVARVTAKELARNIARANSTPELRKIAERLEQRADQLRTEKPAGLAIFAAPPNHWTELDLPFSVQSQSCVANSYCLAPLLPGLARADRYIVLLLDRSVTRLLSVEGEDGIHQLKEVDSSRQEIRETGTSRKVSDERSRDDEAYHRLRREGERILGMLERGMADAVYIGCRNELWPSIQDAVPEGLLRKVVDHFVCDPGLISLEKVVELVEPLMQQRRQQRLRDTVDEAVGGAANQTTGVVGAQNVIRALEQGETQTVVITPHQPLSASICTQCDHIDLGAHTNCSLCSSPVRGFSDFSEVLARKVGRGAFEILVATNGDGIAVGEGFLAKLRFQASKSRVQVA